MGMVSSVRLCVKFQESVELEYEITVFFPQEIGLAPSCI